MSISSIGNSVSSAFTTCWQNCPSTGSVSIFGNKCPSDYPNSTRPNCTINTCYSNCPNVTSIQTYGACPSNWPNTIEPECYTPDDAILTELNEVSPQEEGFVPSEENNNITSDSDGGKDEGEFVPSILTCHSGCPNSMSVAIFGNKCPDAYPYITKPDCGQQSDPLQEAFIEQLEQQIAIQQQAMQDLVDAQAAGSSENQQQIQALLDLINSQQVQISLAQQSSQGQDQIDALESQLAFLEQALLSANNQSTEDDNSESISQITEQFSSLQEQLIRQQEQYQQDLFDRQYSADTQKAGFGDVPVWAIVGGIVMVGLITFIATKK